jgi:hypothetical protein
MSYMKRRLLVVMLGAVNACGPGVGEGEVSYGDVDSLVEVKLAGFGEPGYQDGLSAAAAFAGIKALAPLDSRLYVADASNNRIRLIDADTVSTVAGSGPS